MKKILFFCFLLMSCTAQKKIVNNDIEFSKHPRPYRVFTIGIWQPGYIVLTLVDADKNYFSVKANNNPSLKTDDIYVPQ